LNVSLVTGCPDFPHSFQATYEMVPLTSHLNVCCLILWSTVDRVLVNWPRTYVQSVRIRKLYMSVLYMLAALSRCVLVSCGESPILQGVHWNHGRVWPMVGWHQQGEKDEYLCQQPGLCNNICMFRLGVFKNRALMRISGHKK
jgi:hypothetical protein